MFLDGKEVLSVLFSNDKQSFAVNAAQKDRKSIVGYVCTVSPVLAVTDTIDKQVCAISDDRSKIFCKDENNWLFSVSNPEFTAISFVSSACRSIILSPCDRFLLMVIACMGGRKVVVYSASTGGCVSVYEPPQDSPVEVGWTEEGELRGFWYIHGYVKGYLLFRGPGAEPKHVFESQLLHPMVQDVMIVASQKNTVVILPLYVEQPFTIYDKNSLVATIHLPNRAIYSYSLEENVFMIGNLSFSGAFIFCTKTGSMLHFVDFLLSKSIRCYVYFTPKNILATLEPKRSAKTIQVRKKHTMQAAADMLLELTLLFYYALPPYVVLHVYNCLEYISAVSLAVVSDLDSMADYKHGGKIRVIQKTIKKIELLRKKQSQKRGNK